MSALADFLKALASDPDLLERFQSSEEQARAEMAGKLNDEEQAALLSRDVRRVHALLVAAGKGKKGFLMPGGPMVAAGSPMVMGKPGSAKLFRVEVVKAPKKAAAKKAAPKAPAPKKAPAKPSAPRPKVSASKKKGATKSKGRK